MNVVSRYVNGTLEYCLSGEVKDMDSLASFLSTDKSMYGVSTLRVKTPYNDDKVSEKLISLGYSEVYHAYEVYAPFNFKTAKHEVVRTHVTAEILSGIRDLMVECCARDNTEFSAEGVDPSWYTLGTDVLAVLVGGKLAGFRVYSINGATMKLWMAYVYPEYRRQGIYSSLLQYVLAVAHGSGVAKVSVSTDVTEQPMHGILKKFNFIPVTRTWVER